MHETTKESWDSIGLCSPNTMVTNISALKTSQYQYQSDISMLQNEIYCHYSIVKIYWIAFSVIKAASSDTENKSEPQ